MRTNIGYDQLKNLIVNALRHDKMGSFANECSFLLFDMVRVPLAQCWLSRKIDTSCVRYHTHSWSTETLTCMPTTRSKTPMSLRCYST